MLIAAAGLAGAGKTTSLRYLEHALVGDYVYVGGYLRAEVARRALLLTPDNERAVREELRATRGMVAMAELALPELRRKASGGHVLIDAIYNAEERDFYLDSLGTDLIVLGLDTSFEARAERLALRQERAISREELIKRDAYELEKLRISDVVAHADLVLTNNGPEAELEAQLIRFASGLKQQAPSLKG